MINRITLLLFIGLSFAQDITIAVLEFEGKGVSQSETSTLTDRLRDEIFNTGIYIVLERGKMDEVLKEQGFQQTGCVTSECAVEVGNILGVQQMIGGSIGKVGNIYTVSARVIDVQTGEVLKSANYDHFGDIGQLLIKGMKEVANQLVIVYPTDKIILPDAQIYLSNAEKIVDSPFLDENYNKLKSSSNVQDTNLGAYSLSLTLSLQSFRDTSWYDDDSILFNPVPQFELGMLIGTPYDFGLENFNLNFMIETGRGDPTIFLIMENGHNNKNLQFVQNWGIGWLGGRGPSALFRIVVPRWYNLIHLKAYGGFMPFFDPSVGISYDMQFGIIVGVQF